MTTNISKSEVKEIHLKVRAAVEAVFKAHGYKVGKDTCRYTDFDLKFSIEAIKDDADSVAARARAMHSYDFESHGIDYGTVVTDRTGQRKFKVEGFTRTGKLSARDQRDGKVYTGPTKIFFLDGKPLMSSLDRMIAAQDAKKVAVTTRPVTPPMTPEASAEAAKKGL